MRFLEKPIYRLALRFVVFYAALRAVLNHIVSSLGPETYSLTPFLIPLELALFFFVLAREKIPELSEFKINFIHSAVLLLAAALLFSARIYIGSFFELPTALGLIFLGLAVFGVPLVREVLQKTRGEAMLSIAFTGLLHMVFIALLFFVSPLVRLDAVIVYHLLLLFPGGAVLSLKELPVVGTQNFSVILFDNCSGIESMLLISFLLLLGFALHRRELNAKRFALVFAAGVLGAWLLNILRLYLIVLAGTFHSKGFAIEVLHPYTALSFFVLYFFALWFLALQWAKKKNPKKKR